MAGGFRKIYIGGDDVTRLSEYKRAKYLGRVFQDPMTGTATTMSIEENMAIAARRGQSRGLSWGITKRSATSTVRCLPPWISVWKTGFPAK